MIDALGIFCDEPLGIFAVPKAPVIAFRPRDYQSACIAAIDKGWKQYQKQAVELATGCGKTVIFSAVAYAGVQAGRKTLILAHRGELLDQAIEKLDAFFGIYAGKEQADESASLDDDVVCASIQTMGGDLRLSGWPEDHFYYVVVDECHRTLAPTYLKILDHFLKGGAKILGVTATADRGDKRNLGQFYEQIAFEYGLLDACRDGYLVPPMVTQVPIEIDLRGVKNKRTSEGSDIDTMEAAKRLEPLLRSIANAVLSEAAERKTVIFMPSVDSARLMSGFLREIGLNADYVSGECRDRDEKIAKFKRDETQFMCNAMILSEGFDDDRISCVVVLRPTKIRALYCQCVGRGTRTLTGLIDGLETAEDRLEAIKASRKPNLMILDFLWLSDKLDLVHPVDLVAQGRKDIRAAMIARGGDGDLIELQKEGEKDMMSALEKTVRKNRGKKRRVIDPIQFAVAIGDSYLADWEPTEPWHTQAVTVAQKHELIKAGFDGDTVANKGLASRILDVVFKRQRLGLATVRQLRMMNNFKMENVNLLTIEQATMAISDKLNKKWRRRSGG